jgi:serine/threonine-protein kinase
MYMAPEQARNEADPRTDIYALGVLLFQCISGRTPFVGKESIDIIVKHIREAPPELRSLVAEVPFEVNTLVMKCLQKAPDARFQNMDELLEAMREATSGQGMSGIFVDPRTYSNNSVPRTHTPGGANGQLRSATPAGTNAPPNLVEEESIEVEMGQSELSSVPGRGRLIGSVLGLIALGLSIGGVIAVKATGTDRPTPARSLVTNLRPIAIAEPPRPPAAVKVLFDINSEPQGATVIRDRTVVGTTPFTLPVERIGATPVQVELAFALDGYEGSTVVAQGFEGTVPVRQVLARKSPDSTNRNNGKKKPKPERPSGYKDDPYQ